MSDLGAFLRAWVRDPLRIAAVAPSSLALARIITSEITPGMAPVIELGPGTGVFTRAMIARGLGEADLVLVEREPEFARMLSTRFPHARVLRMDATRLGRHKRLFDTGLAGAVVSGLPILGMNTRQQMMIISGAFELLRHGGSFYQFTYGPVCPVPRAILDRLGLTARRVSGTLRNIPPATVYKISRRRDKATTTH